MKHLVFARHGNYDYDGDEYHINGNGREEMRNLARLILNLAKPGFYILSSPEEVAIESAKVLASTIGLRYIEESPELWSGNLAPGSANFLGNPERAHKLVDKLRDKANTLILVSHLELAEQYPRYFLENEMKLENINGVLEPKKGEAVYFDLENKKYQIIPERRK
ncbi:MAG: hypothetical protein WC781_00110 [Candidatus Pacearchaeota archaeon]|jgi:phosphohistidine phosphatase SixA